jgi:hypothetical protein
VKNILYSCVYSSGMATPTKARTAAASSSSTPAKRGPKNPLSDSHKAALAAGRVEGRTVRRYLDALSAPRPKRKRSPEAVRARLDEIAAALLEVDVIRRLELAQEQLDLEAELASSGDQDGFSDLETEFVKVAKAYGERKGLTYEAWRRVGVEASVLARAGIKR